MKDIFKTEKRPEVLVARNKESHVDSCLKFELIVPLNLRNEADLLEC